MTRSMKPVSLANGKSRWRLRIVDDPSDPEHTDAALFRFMQTLADQPTLLRCGPVYFRKATISHNGTGWVLEAEATAEDPQSTPHVDG